MQSVLALFGLHFSFLRLRNLRQQLITLRRVARATVASDMGFKVVRFLFAGKRRLRSVHCSARRIDGGLRLGEMSFTNGHAVEGALRQISAGTIRRRLRAEAVFEILPVVAGLIICPERAAGIV